MVPGRTGANGNAISKYSGASVMLSGDAAPACRVEVVEGLACATWNTIKIGASALPVPRNAGALREARAVPAVVKAVEARRNGSAIGHELPRFRNSASKMMAREAGVAAHAYSSPAVVLSRRTRRPRAVSYLNAVIRG